MPSATFFTDFASETSRASISAEPPLMRIFSASGASTSLRLPDNTTVAPASASACAPARPMPLPAPVTHATFPLSLLMSRPCSLRRFFRQISIDAEHVIESLSQRPRRFIDCLPRGIYRTAHQIKPVHHAFVVGKAHTVFGFNEFFGIFDAFIAQRIISGNNDQTRRQTCEVFVHQRRIPEIVCVPAAAQVLPVEPRN